MADATDEFNIGQTYKYVDEWEWEETKQWMRQVDSKIKNELCLFYFRVETPLFLNLETSPKIIKNMKKMDLLLWRN